jgi:hypothetical protein
MIKEMKNDLLYQLNHKSQKLPVLDCEDKVIGIIKRFN